MAQRGFTLVEVLTAMALLVIVSLSAAQLLAATASAIRVARMKTAASAYAAARLERLRGDPALAVSGPTAVYLDAGGVPVAAATGMPAEAVYVCRWEVAESSVDARLLVIQVLVRPVAEDAAGERFSRAQVRLTTVRRRER